MVYLRKSLASYGIHTMDYSAKSACRTANRCIQSEDQGQTRLPTLLFSPMIDWIVKTSTFEGMHGIRWTAYMQLDDLDTRDNLALLFHTHEQIQMTKKSKILKYNTDNNNPITLGGEAVESFTYLSSIIDKRGGSDADVTVRIGKARAAFLQLNNTWNTKQLSACQHQIHDLQCERQGMKRIISNWKGLSSTELDGEC
ncbi:unnamed protein product [Schistosoma mattheei]|uniref:Uncharacterized protein n=1 Tax=Schistosoma mattheei TaxID=31246 RepID=A0A183NH58_9TREM|nr:unnamed protein product [Schistosoma mattheei]